MRRSKRRDIDQEVKFWIRDVPYLWIQGKDWPECFRFYVFDVSTIVYNKELDAISVDTALYLQSKGDELEYLSIIPLSGCDQVRNYFLVYTFQRLQNIGSMYKCGIVSPQFKKCEVRMNGSFFKSTNTFKISPKDVVHIDGISKKWYIMLTSGPNVRLPIKYKLEGKDHTFENIYDLFYSTAASSSELEKIHKKAIERSDMYDFKTFSKKEYIDFYKFVKEYLKGNYITRSGKFSLS